MLQAVILIGGKSQRMGEEKYLLDIHGKPQYIHLFEMLTQFNIPTYLSCNKAQFEKLPANYPSIVDRDHAIGPIGGLAATIHHDHKLSVLLVACDLIHLTGQTIQRLVEENDSVHDVITYQKKGSPFKETTITIYNPGAFPYVNKAVEEGNYSLQGILKKCRVKTLLVDGHQELSNANSKKDLH